MHRPGATDPSMIQNKNDTFYVLAPVPNNLSSINWDDRGDDLSSIIINTLEEKIMPELSPKYSRQFLHNS